LSRAVDESLRLEPSVVQLDRFATADTNLGGVPIAAGDFVMVSVSAANRDPDFFADPDRFDVTRENARAHLTFAQGPHLCLGAHLARAETRAALGAAFAGLPGLRLTGPVEFVGTVFRKPKAVPAAWVP
jgi:cytochrome P450